MTCPCCGVARTEPLLVEGTGYRRCLRCGFVFQPFPAVSSSDLVIRHYESVDPHRRVAEAKAFFFHHAISRLNKFHGSDKRLLDVGCGYGYFLETAEASGWQPFGVEISSEAVEESHRKFGDGRVFCGTLEESGFESDLFDAVTFWDVLVFSAHPFADLLEALRILKSGGLIGIRVRNVVFQRSLYTLCKPLSAVARGVGFKKPYVFHPNCFSSASMRWALNRAGFVHISVENSPLTKGDPYGHTRVVGAARLAKRLAEGFAKRIFQLSRGKWVVGPSLLAWAQKP